MSRNHAKRKLPTKGGAKGGARKTNLRPPAGKRKQGKAPPANRTAAKQTPLTQSRYCWCVVCAIGFQAKRSHARTCGPTCRQVLSRRHRKERGVA